MYFVYVNVIFSFATRLRLCECYILVCNEAVCGVLADLRMFVVADIVLDLKVADLDKLLFAELKVHGRVIFVRE